MSGFLEKTVITQDDFDEMCRLAEDVVQQLYMDFEAYDEQGNDIFSKHYRQDQAFEEDTRQLVRKECAAMDELPESRLLYDLFRRGDDIGKVRVTPHKRDAGSKRIW